MRSRTWLKVLVVMILIGFGVVIYLRRGRYGLPEGSPMPHFVLEDYRSKEFDSKSLMGKVAVVIFWKVSVEASVAEVKGLELLWQKYRDRGLEVVAISLDKDGKRYVRSFVARHRVRMPLLIGDVRTAHLFGGLRGVPTIFFFDRQGRVREVLEGFRGSDFHEERILELL